MSATTAREALDAMFVPGCDADQAEFARRVDAVVAEALGGTPDFFQPGHSYTRRDGTTFRCIAVTIHPAGGERLAIGWHTDTADWTFLDHRNLGQWLHEYDGCKPPADAGARSEPGRVVR